MSIPTWLEGGGAALPTLPLLCEQNDTHESKHYFPSWNVAGNSILYQMKVKLLLRVGKDVFIHTLTVLVPLKLFGSEYRFLFCGFVMTNGTNN